MLNWLVYAVIDHLKFDNLLLYADNFNWSNGKMSNWLVYAVIDNLKFDNLIVFADKLQFVE